MIPEFHLILLTDFSTLTQLPDLLRTTHIDIPPPEPVKEDDDKQD
jgi:hypothetical protein